jgi:hypothetical protein
LIASVTIWFWSVVLTLTKVPRGELTTTGPDRLVKHPLYTRVALLVLPWLGLLLNIWLGAAIGIILYLASGRLALPPAVAAVGISETCLQLATSKSPRATCSARGKHACRWRAVSSFDPSPSAINGRRREPGGALVIHFAWREWPGEPASGAV